MSLSKLRKITERGAVFQSHIDGKRHELTPERAMDIQRLLGSDIQMQLDECLMYPHTDKEAERAMRLSLRWAERSRIAFGRQAGRGNFGIVQGGVNTRLRRESAEGLVGIGFEGYAIGGLAVGEGQKLMLETISHTVPHLPDDRPRYLMGVGTPEDILESVARGIDMFDCVLPTRSGRHGQAFTRFGKINLRNARHAADPRPLDPESPCPAQSQYSRAYLHHLVRSGELLGMMLLSWANVAYYQELMAGIRAAIAAGRFEDFRLQTKEQWKRGDVLVS
jgi:queuine tRNA-ribosyltransferase